MNPHRYRKKPIEIEAVQVPLPENEIGTQAFMIGHGRLAGWFMRHQFRGYRIAADLGVDIDTLEGTMHASPGDWIIRGVQGEFYPCKPDIFASTYEPAGP